MVLRMTGQRKEPVIATVQNRAGILSEFRNPRPAPFKEKKKMRWGIHSFLGRVS